MPPPCSRCRHARQNHGKWWVDRLDAPCRVRNCDCPGYVQYCRRGHDPLVRADGTVYCARCDWELPQEAAAESS